MPSESVATDTTSKGPPLAHRDGAYETVAHAKKKGSVKVQGKKSPCRKPKETTLDSKKNSTNKDEADAHHRIKTQSHPTPKEKDLNKVKGCCGGCLGEPVSNVRFPVKEKQDCEVLLKFNLPASQESLRYKKWEPSRY